MRRVKQRFYAWAIVLCMLPSMFAIPAYAETNTDGMWTNRQKTQNLIPPIIEGQSLAEQGWGNIAKNVYPVGWKHDDYGVGIRAAEGEDLGTDKYTEGVYYTIKLSEADKTRANLGQLSISASSRNYLQGWSSDHLFSIRAECYSASGSLLAEIKKTQFKDGKAGANDSNYVLELNAGNVNDGTTVLPAGTDYIQLWFSNWGNLAGRPWICEMQCYLHDTTAPAFSSASLNTTNITGPENGICIAGDTLAYEIKFNEAVQISASGSADITIDGTDFATSSEATVSGDTVTYTFTLPDHDKSGAVSLKNVSGLTVTDDAGNAYTYSGSPEVGTVQYYKTMSVTNNLTNITSSNTDTTAKYGTDYNTTLSVNAGYSLPQSMSVTMGGVPIVVNQDYSYNSVDGYLSIFGTAIKGDIVITASAVPNQYTVTLDGNGATTSGTPTVTATFGEDMPAATMPQKLGYTFLGYFTEKQGGTQYYSADGSSAKEYDIPNGTTLYAQWSANNYTITYNKNKPASATHEIEGTMEDSQFVYDTEGTLRKNTYALEGWTFKGWATSAESGVVYTDEQSISNLIDKGNITLYAVWEPIACNATLNAMGGSGSTILTASYDAAMPGITQPSRPGYTFLGYFDQEEGGKKYYNDDGTSASLWDKTSDTTLYAQWKPIRYNIHFYSMGEYISVQADVEYGKLRLPSAEALGISREHYNFVGWNIYDEQNWGMYMADTDYSVGLATKEGETVYLYAAWLEKDKFQITYDANGGSGAPSPVVIHQDETIALSDQLPVRANYTFLGWATSSDAAEPEYQPSDSFTMGNSLVTLYAVWQKNPQLSYNANGGAFSYYVPEVYPPAASTVTITEAVPERVGYYFLGWAKTQDAQAAEVQPSDPMIMPASDTVLYAVWEKISYPITKNVADGYTVNGLSDTYYYGDTASFTVTGDVPPKVYINGVETPGDNGSYVFTVIAKTDVVIVSSEAFNVIYNGNDGIDAPVDIFGYDENDLAIIKNETPTRTGYTFLGWADNASAEEAKYHAGDQITITSDTVLYAVWAQNEYTISFDANYGSGDMVDIRAKYDTSVTLSENTFIRKGYRFLGWTTVPEYGVMYYDKTQVKNLTAENNKTVTLYAVWETAETIIVLNAEGGAGGSTTISVKYDSMLSDQGLRMPERYGYTFGGYYTEKDGHGEILFDENMKVSGRYASAPWDNESQTLEAYAYWIPVSYKIVYINGDEQLNSEQSAKFGVPFNLYTGEELGIVTPEGYHLAGWSTAPGSSTVYYTDGQEITTGLTGTDRATVYLYAVISENDSYTLSYDANGGSGAPPSQTKKLTGGADSVTMQISDAVPSKDGYSFACWNTQSDGSGQTYASGGEIEIFGNTTIYAVWTRLGEYMVTYHGNAEDAVYGMPAPQNKVENVPLTLSRTIPMRTGYRFLGWAQAPDGALMYEAGKEYQYTENKSLDLYAVWKGESFTVILPESGEGYTVSEPGAQKTVGYGGEVAFTITIHEGYTAERMIISANGMALGFSLVEGNVYSYVLKNVTSNSNITVHDVLPVRFTVILTDGTGYTVTPQSQMVNYGQDVQFTVTLAEGYKTATPSVYVNGQPISGAVEGDSYIYTINQVKSQPVISISVVEKERFDIVFVNGESIYTIVNVEDGQLLTEPEPPTKDGYKFCGWYTDKETTQPYNFIIPVTSAFVLYAKWEANTYTASYDANTSDPVSQMPNSQQKQYGVPLVLSANIPQREGYVFIGWNTLQDGSGTRYQPSDEYTINADVTLYAQWKLAVCTVTFMADNKVYRVVQANYNSLLDEITPPHKDGYVFDGWYNSDKRWNFAQDRVTGNLTLNAVFSGENFTVTPPVFSEGFTFTSESIETVPFGGNYTFTVSVAEHYSAENIRVTANGIVLTPTIAGRDYHYTIKNITSDCMIFVEGVEKEIYTVEYLVDGELYRSTEAMYGAKLQRPVTPSKEGHVFAGWFNGDTEWDFENHTVLGNLTLDAKFDMSSYTITLPSNTAEYTITAADDTEVMYGGSFTFTVTVSEGFDAAAMVVLANGIQLTTDSNEGNAFTYTISQIGEPQTITIRGIGQDVYSITYKAGTFDYVGGLPDGAIKQHGMPAVISDAVPVRNGYIFLGWSSVENADVPEYIASDLYETDADVTLYAVWEAETYQVVYEENGGSEIPDTQYTYGQGLVLPGKAEILREGFEFVGWYDNERLEGVAVTEITDMDIGDKTFYARWKAAAITPQGYEGVYDGESHAVTFDLAEPLQVERYQWYFKAEGSDIFVPVNGEAYNIYSVQNVTDSGIYYCTLEFLQNGYVARVNTNECKVKITPKPITITAASASKVYDKAPLVSVEYTQEGLVNDTQKIDVTMTADSTITNTGSCENKIETVMIKNADGTDITGNYEITKAVGTLTVTPAILKVEGKNITVYKNNEISIHSLYTLSGMLGEESLSANAQIESIKDAKGNVIESLDEVSKSTGTYTVNLSYNNFSGDGSENYSGSGTVTTTVTVKSSGGGSSGGGGGGSSVTTSYTVTFDTQGGSKIDSIKVNKNSTVVKPEDPTKEGYTFEGWFTDKECATAYDFDTKVTKNITLYAKWTEEKGEPTDPTDPAEPDEWENPFNDVSDDDWFYNEVKDSVKNGWFSGTTETTFSPNEPITRGMLVTVLWRIENKPVVNYLMTFEDVDESAYYGEAVRWAASAQIVKGYSETEFAPDKLISREEMAAIINRYANYKKMIGTQGDISNFTDKSLVADWAYGNMEWAVGTGLISGTDENKLNPQGNTTRAETAAILQRLLEK